VQALRTRSFFIAIVALGYVVFAALQSRDGSGAGWLALLLFPFALAVVWVKTQAPTRGEDPIDPTVRSATRVTAVGTALLLSSWTGEPGVASLLTGANVGTALATVAALFSLARISGPGGLLQPPAASKRLDATSLAAMVWGTAIMLPLARALAPEATTMLDPLSVDIATLVASSGALGLLIAASFRVRALRRLELGVSDRAGAAFALSVVTLAIAIPASLLRVAPPDRVMAAAGVIAACCVQLACVSQEPGSVAKTMRTALGMVLLGAPVGLAGVALSLRAPQSTGLLILVVGGLSILVGLVAPALSGPVGPARSRWLQAIQKANEAALHPDPDVALRDSLTTVRSLLPGDSASPTIFQASPPQMLTIDRAGYLHTHEIQAPMTLYDIAQAEPERAIRTEVLRAMEVRRAELRPLVQWMDARGMLSVTLIRDEDGPVGLLGIPRGKRRTPMSLEEVRAVRVLADRIGAVLGVSSALARSRQRELELRQLAERRADEIDRLRFQLSAKSGRMRAHAERLALPLRATTYSPAAAMALEQVRRLGAMDIPVTLLTPPGVDPIAWAAEAHLASSHASSPFVIVYGTDTSEHDIDRWRAADTSPLSLADGGTLFVIDIAALPRTVQDYIASCLAERIAPGQVTPLDIVLMVSVPATADVLVAAARLSSTLADWLGDRAVPLPELAARPEDLRALVLDQLARAGTRLRGAPLGIDDRALARLMEHQWPGNDVELADVLLRATLVAQEKRVTLEDLQTIGFIIESSNAESSEPPPSLAPTIPKPRRRRH